ncbi:uncharacterized protein LOC143544179 isoform X2 [Bidens hawaiensis]|uniref:uncharacterized protein LOC143544179 isoform X2 n=1 Tax=Bidens hawaiensis TaxID=980011 RepID=UPI004049C757
MLLPSHIDFKRLLALDLTACPNLKSLACLPIMLERLYVDWCSSLEDITFQSARFTLREFNCEGCFKLSDIQGLFKLVPISKLDEADLGHMQWIKVYQDHNVDLVGDVITKGRSFNIQMLYEYGIRSTFLQGVTDQSMATHEYTSSFDNFSFHVPLHPKKHRIQGLYVKVIYRSLGENTNTEPPPLFATISNRSKGVTWVYNPVVYCKPRVDEDAIWLSYWPIGDTLDAGDEVHVDIIVKEGTISTSGFGVSVVYMDAGEAEKEEEKSEMMKSQEVIEGDLSLFEVKGGFYLCRRDFYRSMIHAIFLVDDIRITDSTRWRTHHLHHLLTDVYEEMNDVRNPDRRKIEVTLGVSFISDDETCKIKNVVSSVEGVESVSTHKEIGRLIVCGSFDPSAVVKCLREFKKMAQIISIYPL